MNPFLTGLNAIERSIVFKSVHFFANRKGCLFCLYSYRKIQGFSWFFKVLNLVFSPYLESKIYKNQYFSKFLYNSYLTAYNSLFFKLLFGNSRFFRVFQGFSASFFSPKIILLHYHSEP